MAKARKTKGTKNLRDLRDPLDYPETRIERYLKCIKTGDNTGLPSTVNTRIERYLYCIATGDNSTLPDHPETMIELYLDAIATGNVSDLPHDPQDRLQRYLYAAAYVDSTLLPAADYTRLEKYISSILGGTTFVTDQAPYLFRVSGGDENANVKYKELDTIVGATMAWNQQIQNGNFESTSGWTNSGSLTTFSVTNNIATVTMLVDIPESGKYAYGINRTIKSTIINHLYMISLKVKTDGTAMGIDFDNTSSGSRTITGLTSGVWNNVNIFVEATNGNSNKIYLFPSDLLQGQSINFQFVMLTDLTLMLGPTVADYVYTLESGTPGDGIAWLKSHGFFTKPYYAYDAGSLQSVCVSAHRMTGFNQWNEEWEVGKYSTSNGEKSASTENIRSKNIIKCFGNTTYGCTRTNNVAVVFIFYDGSGNFISSTNITTNPTFTTPANCEYFAFYTGTAYGTTYKNDICINLSQADTSVSPHNGEYLPHTLHTYALDHSVTRRGIYKLDADNKLYADGDTDDGKGTETVAWKEGDLGTPTWDYNGVRFIAEIDDLISKAGEGREKGICPKYARFDGSVADAPNKSIIFGADTDHNVYIKDSAYTDAATFKIAMDGVPFVYKKNTPTTATVETFVNPQQVDRYGTEEYVDFPYFVEDRDVEVPVGHITQYPQ